MTSQELLKQNEKMIREEWFNNHKVLEYNLLGYNRSSKSAIETLVWGKPVRNGKRD